MLQSRRSRYTVSMARGWESKSVEDQIGAAEAERELRNRQQLSTGEREQNERKQSLLLSRSLILSRIKAARDPRYRAQLKVTLDQLDEQLREITDDSRGD
ncbi:MAG TPA: hypothetical protein VHP99_03795 [Pyrinomonadaceae bacterium]|jgi:hypothetical protein|nr:hypothetical protein [Pyrinomonadaceae bacterium]